MTTDDRIRAALQARAHHAPHPDHAGAVIWHRRRTRQRRLVATGVVAGVTTVALLGLAVLRSDGDARRIGDAPSTTAGAAAPTSATTVAGSPLAPTTAVAATTTTAASAPSTTTMDPAPTTPVTDDVDPVGTCGLPDTPAPAPPAGIPDHATLTGIRNAVVGRWIGTPRVPDGWIPIGPVWIDFHSDGTYAAGCIDDIGSGETVSYYGYNCSCATNRYALVTANDEGSAEGDIDISWLVRGLAPYTTRGQLHRVTVTDTTLHFEFFRTWAGTYGPVVYDLERA